MIGSTTSAVTLDTVPGDITVDMRVYSDKDFPVWIQTRWGDGVEGNLTVNTATKTTLATDAEQEYELRLISDEAATYALTWTSGNEHYARTIHALGAYHERTSGTTLDLQQTMIGSTTSAVTLDTVPGDVTVDMRVYSDKDFPVWIQTRWGDGAEGNLTVNTATKATLATDAEQEYELRLIGDEAATYALTWTSGGEYYARTIHALGAYRERKSGTTLELQQTMIGSTTSAVTLATVPGDITVDMRVCSDKDFPVWLQTRWGDGVEGNLTVNTATKATLATDAEQEYELRLIGDEAATYALTWTSGGEHYARTIHALGAYRERTSGTTLELQQTMIGSTVSTTLDTVPGDIVVDMRPSASKNFPVWLMTRWGDGDAGELMINGALKENLAADGRKEHGLYLQGDVAAVYDLSWTVGGTLYARTVRTLGAYQSSASAGIMLDTIQGVRELPDAGVTLVYDSRWYADCETERLNDNFGTLVQGTEGTYLYKANNQVCQYNLELTALNASGQAVGHATASFKGLEEKHGLVITKEAIEPTSDRDGRTAEWSCPVCGKVMVASEVVRALGYARNATARQLWPFRKVEIAYELADDINTVLAADTALMLTATYGGVTKTAAHVLGDVTCTPGRHCVVWNMDLDGISASSEMVFKVAYGSITARADSVSVNVLTSVKDGMSVEKELAWDYSPIDGADVELIVDGESFLSATNSGTFAWQPRTLGEHTLKHVVDGGTYTWVRTVNVTSLVYEEPTPNPPTAEDANISLGSDFKNFTSSAKSAGTITTSGSGTWTASTSASWITIPYVSRKAGTPVVYSIAANTEVEERTGYVYVSGHVFKITQAGVGAELDATSCEVEMDGGVGSFTVLADAQTSWHARANVDWIMVKPTVATGEVAVVFTVAPWSKVSTRSGTITAAGCTFTVNQTGRHIKLNLNEESKDYLAHDIVLSVDALSSTEWGVAVDASWMSIVDGGSGKGAGSVALAIAENPSYLARTCAATIGTESYVVHQQGRPTAELAFTISPDTTTASVDGANGLISVLATPDLPWTAKSAVNWLTVMPSFGTGAGNGNVVYVVSPNPTMEGRTGTISVTPEVASGLSGLTHTVSQPAAEAMISVDSNTFAAAGESFDVDVTVDDIVNWSVENSADWVSIDGDLSRLGPGKVTIAVEPNLSIEPREATVTIARHTFTVCQQGRTVSVEYTSKTFGPNDDLMMGTIDVHPDGNVTWTAHVADEDLEWITIWFDEGGDYDDNGNLICTGDNTISYILTDYVGNGDAKTGRIIIGDKVVYVTQRAYDFTIDPCATEIEGNAGAGMVGVPATEGQLWNAIATEPWITVVNTNGTGKGTVQYTFTENDTGVSRTGKIIISGEEYTITQAARQMVTITVSKTIANGGLVAGAGTYNLGTAVELTATPADGYAFTGWECPDGSTSESNPFTVTADVNKEIVAKFRLIPVYTVNGEEVREGTIKSFTAPDPVILGGTTQLVCLGTSAYPNKGASFQIQVTGNIDFSWDLWQTNYWVAIEQSEGGTVSGATGWIAADTEVAFTATPAAGKAFYRWSGLDDGGRGATALPGGGSRLTSHVSCPIVVSAIFGTFADTLATAADASALTFTTGGDAAWTPVIDATAQAGYSSVRSGTIGAEAESWLETTISNAGTLSFRWRTDCEHDDSGSAIWDRLAVFTNGVEAARLDGTTSWQSVSLPLTDPKTTIRWSFYRDDYDDSSTTNQNCGWLDGLNVEQ